jgi:hypothetical protein
LLRWPTFTTPKPTTHPFTTTHSFTFWTKRNGFNNQVLGLQQTNVCMGE